MKSAWILRDIVLGFFVATLVLVVPAARAGEDTIKIGILHSLSGTMAISESVLKDTVLMLIADQNKKGGLLGQKLEPIIVDPASDWDVFAEKARELLTKERVAVQKGAGMDWRGSKRPDAAARANHWFHFPTNLLAFQLDPRRVGRTIQCPIQSPNMS
jgi:Periplasmic binding protein domain